MYHSACIDATTVQHWKLINIRTYTNICNSELQKIRPSSKLQHNPLEYLTQRHTNICALVRCRFSVVVIVFISFTTENKNQNEKIQSYNKLCGKEAKCNKNNFHHNGDKSNQKLKPFSKAQSANRFSYFKHLNCIDMGYRVNCTVWLFHFD